MYSNRMGDDKKPIIEHLEELRKRIIISIIAVALLSVLSYAFSDTILRYLARYVKTLVFLSPQEAFLSHVKVALFCGLVLAAPIILFQILRFIWIALNSEEQGIFIVYFSIGTFLFVCGALFSYFAVLPTALHFLLGFSSDIVRPYISISNYISFSAFLILAFAVAFETPLLITLLARVGIINAALLRKKRKYFIVLLFVILFSR